MSIFEKLTDKDQELIKLYIQNYGSADGGYIRLKTPLECILRFWTGNKEDLYRLFGGEFILSRKVSYDKPTHEIENDVYENILNEGEGRAFYRHYDNWCDRFPEWRWNLRTLMYSHNLASNIYTGESFELPTPDGHTIAINTGCKISKVLGKIAKAFDLPNYEAFRIAHSQCLNQKKLNGELCISIHPLDYMTMSDNDCGWDSCMSWLQPGDYRLGTVEMMNSPCVVVAYLKSYEDMEVPGGYWNSKKWRQLFIVTPEMISGIRQYPYKNDELSGTVLKWLRTLAETNMLWGPYSDTAVKINNFTDNTFANTTSGTSYIHISTAFMYNDYHSDHDAFIIPDFPTRYELCFSGPTSCVCCGEDMSHYDDSEHDPCVLTCDDCEHICRCAECGNRINPDDAFTVNGCTVCEYCYNEYFDDCTLCEKTEHKDYLYYIYLADGDNITNYYIKACEECKDSDKFREMFGEIKNLPWGRWDRRDTVQLDNLTIDGLEQFDVWYGEDYEKFKARIESRTKDEI